jgi:geranylgeranyl diphosphate synthase type II
VSATPHDTLHQYLNEIRRQVDEELERLLPGAQEYPPSIHQAMRHSVFAGGKRLRPILCLESGRLFQGEEKSLVHLGCALELIHTYSLIHDDLPALDNDDLRRGKPTCHRVYGEATAILAGDALLTLGFEVLSAPGLLPEGRSPRIIHELAHAIGTRGGMVGGQVVDLEAAGRQTDAATLQYIHSAKTGAFIRAAVRCGALGAHAPEEDLARLTVYGAKIGLAFQIADDLLDVTGSKEELGKSVGKDGQQQKATYPAIHGLEESQRIASQLVREACAALEPYGDRAQTLHEIAHFLITRKT